VPEAAFGIPAFRQPPETAFRAARSSVPPAVKPAADKAQKK